MQYATNLTLYFPIKIDGAAPTSVDGWTVTPSDTAQFTAEFGVIPAGSNDVDSSVKDGDPCVVTNALTHDGATSLSFTVTDGNANDVPGVESFDYIAPVAPPPPPHTITVDDAGVVSQLNPNAP